MYGETETMYKFMLGMAVAFEQSDEEGLVIGRAEYLTGEPQYYIRYKAGDGRQVEQWWGESALTFRVG